MTIREIAQTLNLSNATVSKALNGSSDISAETKKIICDYAQSVGYRTRKSMALNGRIAILWGKYQKQSGALYEIARAFRTAAEEARYVVVTDTMEDDGERKFNLNDYLAYNHFYGALLLDLNFNSPVYSQLGRTKYPLVLADNYLSGNPLISGVGSDNIHAMQEAVDYLVSLGHEKIAFLGGERESLVGVERFVGYILGLAKNGIEYRYDLTYFGNYYHQTGVEAAEYFLKNEKEFTAIICASDLMAIGFIERMRACGRHIPDEISVIGCDDLQAASAFDLKLTTMRQDFGQIGTLGFKMFDCLIKGIPSQRALVPCKLVPRESTKKLIKP